MFQYKMCHASPKKRRSLYRKYKKSRSKTCSAGKVACSPNKKGYARELRKEVAGSQEEVDMSFLESSKLEGLHALSSFFCPPSTLPSVGCIRHAEHARHSGSSRRHTSAGTSFFVAPSATGTVTCTAWAAGLVRR